MILLLAFALVPAFQTQRSRAPEPGEEAPRSYIYYDYIEDGELRGGTVAIDPTNPLHVDTGRAQDLPRPPCWTTGRRRTASTSSSWGTATPPRSSRSTRTTWTRSGPSS